MENPVITQATPPIEDELMRLARLGAIKEIQALFDSGKYDANSSDAQGITPLHVCQIYPKYTPQTNETT